MIYDTSDPDELIKAADQLAEFGARGKVVDMKVVRAGRTLSQNAFLHTLLGGLGNFLGYNLDEMKTIYKREINPSLYVYDRNGRKFLKSSTELTKEEMSASIDKLRMFAEAQGYPLPAESDVAFIRQLQNELERAGYDLR